MAERTEIQEELLEAALGELEEGIAVLDSQSRVRFWNPAAAEISGYLSADLLSRSLPEDSLRSIRTIMRPRARQRNLVSAPAARRRTWAEIVPPPVWRSVRCGSFYATARVIPRQRCSAARRCAMPRVALHSNRGLAP
jgi:PAS domain S-box-containing protein